MSASAIAKKYANQIDVYNIYAATPSLLPQLKEVIARGTYGAIYKTTAANVVAKVIQFKDTQLEYYNTILSSLISDKLVRPFLPFFKNDEEAKAAGIPVEDGIPVLQWVAMQNKDGKPSDFAILYMEKLDSVDTKSESKNLTINETAFVDCTIGLLEHIAEKHKCFFVDLKLANLMQRNTITAPVLVDLDSIVTYNEAYRDDQKWWYGIGGSYHAFNAKFKTVDVPLNMSEPTFNNVSLYIQRTACLCMLVDWLHSSLDIYNVLRKFPCGKSPSETKHQFCRRLIEERFGALTKNSVATLLLTKFQTHEPFNWPPKDEYGSFLSCRSTFYDRTLV